ncbi:MAG: molybdate ABC transporter substrate-binding protein [Betaproteobacteria bacterium]|nr:molybdate ABC transporter substrate-binding protein [Betaproteobacteria bacterium]
MRALFRAPRALRALLLVLGMLLPACAQAQALVVFAAASLRNALDAAAQAYEARGGGKITVSYAASSALARQIEAGAPAQVFISADEKWMDYLEQRHLVQAGSRHDLLANRLVLIEPASRKHDVTIAPGFRLRKLLNGGRLALADPASVPAGLYAKAALEKLGVWASVKDRVAPAENVRSALAFVARGEAPLGIVYATDAQVEPRVRVAGTFPADSHPPIVYPVALTTAPGWQRAEPFEQFLRSPEARAIFRRWGFTPLN